MAVQYLHGLETIELDSPSGPVETIKSNVIGIIGTAPDADPALFPVNVPVALFSNSQLAIALGTDGTLFDAVEAVYSQKAATIVVVRVEEGTSIEDTWAAAVGSPVLKTGVWAFLKARPLLRVVPKILCAPGLTGGRPTDGLTDVDVVLRGSGYVQGTVTVTFSAPPSGGVRATGTATVVNGKVTAINIIAGGAGYVTAPTVTIGGGSGTGATGRCTLGAVANPVGKALEAIVDRLRAVAFIDGPNTSRSPAVRVRMDYGSQRVMILDPGVLVFDTETSAYVNRPASAYAAGLQARIDSEKGFWYSISNELIQNIGGPSRPVDWMPNDPDSEANSLNAAQVTTIIHADGFRFWGLRGCGDDPLWAQLSVRRTADMIYESIERAERVRLDKPFSRQLLTGIQRDVNDYLALMKVRGALMGGKAHINPQLNTAQTFAAGELTVDFDLEPTACLEHLIFQAVRNPQYYTDFIESFSRPATNA